MGSPDVWTRRSEFAQSDLYHFISYQYIYKLMHSASELGFTCTSSLTMNEKFHYRTRLVRPRAVLKISSSLLVNESR